MRHPYRPSSLGAAALLAGLLLSLITPVGAMPAALPAQAAPTRPPTVVTSAYHDVSPALRDLPARTPDLVQDPAGPASEIPLVRRPMTGDPTGPAVDPVLQDGPAAGSMPAPLLNFEGVSNRNGVHPPDTQGDVGPNHYVQWVNLSFAIWDKAGHLLYGPADGSTLWQGFGGPCQTRNDGDPVTLYDNLADRWVMTQFALPAYPDGPFYECIAVSQTPDPLGAWYRYAFRVHETKMDDYPKLGVWPDAYYMTVNQFTSTWAGAGVFAFDRNRMLQGQAASFVYFDLADANLNYGGMLPADLDGSTPPPAGTGGIFAEVDPPWGGYPSAALRLWEFHVDWDHPLASTFGLGLQPNLVLPVQSFAVLCSSTRACIPQAGTSARLDGIGDRLMFRLQYRNFGDRQTLVVNHNVDAGGGRAGVRWYELRRSGESAWDVYQQGTFAPDDGNHRWMGSIAMDGVGNIALGYSVSGSGLYPSIRYTGRLAGDPVGLMTQEEAELIAGTGAQTSPQNRWGDYSSLTVDPADDCTFWYTNEYLATTGYAPWQTRIGAFKFPSCTPAGAGTLSGLVSDQATADPVAAATVQATGSGGQTQSTTTGGSGQYTLLLAEGTYTVTASAFGYETITRTGIAITGQGTTSLDLPLPPRDRVSVSGHVTDALTGWPLYAALEIDGGPSGTLWNDPVTGYYSILLPADNSYTFHVTPWASGYVPVAQAVGPLLAPATVDFTASADATACSAPGYSDTGGPCQPARGSLVVGNVSDANTGDALTGAAMSSDSGATTITETTPDPAVPDGFYTIFAAEGERTITASLGGGYAGASSSLTAANGQTVRHDFELAAGRLAYTPAGLAGTAVLGSSRTLSLELRNTGTLPLNFSLVGLARQPVPLGPVERPSYALKPFRQNYRDARGQALFPAPAAQGLAAGSVFASWQPDIAAAYGIAFDTVAGTLWVASPEAGWGGAGLLREYQTEGTPTGRTRTVDWDPPYGPADLAFDRNTGQLWAMNVDPTGSNCIYEIAPGGEAAGHRICPGGPTGFSYSQRGLAYDPTTDSWFAGGWNDFMIYHFDRSGQILDAVNVGLAIAGLAYNPSTGHLFAMTNHDPNVVYVLDTEAQYALAGKFSVSEGFGAFAGAGIEMDCAGNLWAVDQQSGTVYGFTSGETTTFCLASPAWLSVTPASGTISPQSVQTVSVTLSAAEAAITPPGEYLGQIVIDHDTPYAVPNVPVTLTVGLPQRGLAVAPTTARGHGNPGATVSYTLHVTNTGEAPDSFAMQASGGGWVMELPATVGPLAPGASADVQATVHIPATALGAAEDTTWVLLSSVADPGAQTVATLTTTANTMRKVAVTPTQASRGTWPGEVATYTLTVANQGNAPDHFTVQAQGGGWPVEAPAATETLSPGATAQIVVKVQVPANAGYQATNKTTVVVGSAADPARTATATLTTRTGFGTFLPALDR